MKPENTGDPEFSQREVQLIQQLRQQPAMMERVQSILDLTRNAEGPLKTADEVEGWLIQEMRRLGHTCLNQWATQAEERVSRELKGQDATVRSRKKDAAVVVRCWVGGRG
jgi:phosphoribosyl-dephospho-CoA transferase